jgi:hypothetical protein
VTTRTSQPDLPVEQELHGPGASEEPYPVPPGGEAPPASKALTTPASTDVRSLMLAAIENGKGIEAVQVLERLVALEEKAQARVAAEEFAKALAAFQAECPPVPKNKTASIVSENKGTSFSYQYAELPVIARHVAPYLKKVGLSYKWDSAIEGDKITVFCTVRHVAGHAETNKCQLPLGTRAGMSEQQKVAAARTFGERLSLIEGLGITTADPDLDGAEPDDKLPRITQEQADTLRALGEEVQVDKEKFFAALGVSSFEGIRASQYHTAVQMLERRRARHQQGAAT